MIRPHVSRDKPVKQGIPGHTCPGTKLPNNVSFLRAAGGPSRRATPKLAGNSVRKPSWVHTEVARKCAGGRVRSYSRQKKIFEAQESLSRPYSG